MSLSETPRVWLEPTKSIRPDLSNRTEKNIGKSVPVRIVPKGWLRVVLIVGEGEGPGNPFLPGSIVLGPV